ncbi:MAG: 2-dehydropantoate 2-reductase [Firmicutes bacterium]|nr:2-dehydropantoate 2-reductase [Bacillota bacterium]
MRERIESAAIVGMGALGMLYGGIIRETLGPGGVCFIMDKDRLDRYRNEECLINGKKTDFRLCGIEEARPADLVIAATKSTGLKEALPALRAATGPETTVISVLNGITSEEIIAEVIPRDQIVDCVSLGMDAVREGRTLTYHSTGKLQIPRKDAEKQAAIDRLVRFFEETGITYETVEDIRRAMWTKFMLNVGINQVSAVSGVTYRESVQPGEALEEMKAAMREVLVLSEKEEIFLTEEDLDNNIRIIRDLGTDGIPSMRQDILAGRKTEVELFAGAVIEKARKHGIPVPVNTRLYRQIRAMEESYL